jgi:hypothetical protein
MRRIYVGIVSEEFGVVTVNVYGAAGIPSPELTDGRCGADGVADTERGAPDRNPVTNGFFMRGRR